MESLVSKCSTLGSTLGSTLPGHFGSGQADAAERIWRMALTMYAAWSLPPAMWLPYLRVIPTVAHMLTCILAIYLAADLTYFLTSSLTFYLTYILAFCLAFCLTYILAFYLTFYPPYSLWLSIWHSFWQMVRVHACSDVEFAMSLWSEAAPLELALAVRSGSVGLE